MATSLTLNEQGSARQLRMLAIVLLPVLGLLALGYFLLVRTDYAVLAQDLRPAEAGAIVAELKKQDVPYRLESQGRTILVPSAKADELRLAVSGGAVSEPGSVGFELFNESDMGLTDFAQKINYQRALQGELARTIMGMDGVAHARVHLALPERSLFRASRSEPRAAVTIVPKPGTPFDAARVAGIQRLVASTVADLRIENVAVLNQRGELLTSDPGFAAPDRMSAATAIERAYAKRIGGTLSGIVPDLSFDLKVTTIPSIPDSESGTEPQLLPANQRDYAVRVVLFTPRPLATSRQAELEQAIGRAIGVTPAAGDDIQFSIEPRAEPASSLDQPPFEGSAGANSEDASSRLIDGPWIEIAGLGAAALGALAMYLVMRRRRLARREQLYSRLRDQLLIEQAAA